MQEQEGWQGIAARGMANMNTRYLDALEREKQVRSALVVAGLILGPLLLIYLI